MTDTRPLARHLVQEAIADYFFKGSTPFGEPGGEATHALDGTPFTDDGRDEYLGLACFDDGAKTLARLICQRLRAAGALIEGSSDPQVGVADPFPQVGKG